MDDGIESLSGKMISASFLGRQEAAIVAQSAVCHALVMAGIDVTHMGLKLAKTRQQFRDYAMGHDMIAHVGNSSIPIEVKSSRKSWTSVTDYPSSRPLVCSQATANKKGMVSNGVLWITHVLVSQPTGAMLAILPGTGVIENVDWMDRTRREKYQVVQCLRSDLKDFKSLVEYLFYQGNCNEG